MKHMQSKHGYKRGQGFKCYSCGKRRIANPAQYVRHRDKNGQGLWRCVVPGCSNVMPYRDPDSLRMHVELQHNPGDHSHILDVPCPHQGTYYMKYQKWTKCTHAVNHNYGANMKRHFNDCHQGIKAWTCPKCHKTFHQWAHVSRFWKKRSLAMSIYYSVMRMLCILCFLCC